MMLDASSPSNSSGAIELHGARTAGAPGTSAAVSREPDCSGGGDFPVAQRGGSKGWCCYAKGQDVLRCRRSRTRSHDGRDGACDLRPADPSRLRPTSTVIHLRSPQTERNSAGLRFVRERLGIESVGGHGMTEDGVGVRNVRRNGFRSSKPMARGHQFTDHRLRGDRRCWQSRAVGSDGAIQLRGVTITPGYWPTRLIPPSTKSVHPRVAAPGDLGPRRR